MTGRVWRGHPRGMSSADPLLSHVRPIRPVGTLRRRGADRVRTTQRWAVSVLALATVVLLAWAVALVAASWLAVTAVAAVTSAGPVSFDLRSVAAGVAPVLLVGWCTGLACAAVLAGGEALGARAAGIVAGAVGSTAGVAVMALTGLLP